MPFPPIYLIVAGGITLLTLLIFQVLVGKRVIKLGKNHLKVHKWVGYGLIAFAVMHGAGAVYLLLL
jgi:hypothetical protein